MKIRSVVEELRRSMASSSGRDESQVAADRLCMAAHTGKLELLKKCAAELNYGETLAETFLRVKDSENFTALHVAAQAGRTHICKYLIQSLKLDVNLEDKSGNTPLHHAMIYERYQTVEFLLNNGAYPSKPMPEDGCTPLHIAAHTGRRELIRLLIEKGAKIESKAPEDGTPLHSAAACGKKDAVIALLKYKANPNALSDQHVTPLIMAIAADSFDCMELLLKAGADPNSRADPKSDSLGFTPLSCAATEGKPEAVKLLLKYGADPNVTDSNGLTPLEMCAMKGRHEACKILFPVTNKIPYYKDWTLKGILKYGNSEEASHQREVKRNDCFAYSKSMGEAAFKKKDYKKAVFWYSEALDAEPNDAAVLSNRSLSQAKLNEGELALADAVACVSVKPDWAKGYYRAGVAYTLLKNYVYATRAFSDANKLDPDNKEIQAALRKSVQAEFGIPVDDRLKLMHL